jgi:hypothetical protein
VVTIFRRLATGRGTSWGRTLGELVLLLLKGEQIIDPFNDKKTLEEAEIQSTTVERLPGDRIEDIYRPSVVATKVWAIGGETAEASELGGEMMSNSSGADVESASTGRQEGDSGKWVDSCSKEAGSNLIALDIQTDFPGKVLLRSLVILVAGDMMKYDVGRNQIQEGEDLKLNISFGEEVTTGVRVLESSAFCQSLEKTLAVGVVRDRGDEEWKL